MKTKVAILGLSLVLFASCGGPGGRRDVVSQKYVHKYGLEVPSSDWASRGQDGKVISTLNTGVLLTENYEKGKRQGTTTYTYPHSEIVQKTEFYDNDRLIRVVFNTDAGWPESEERYLGDGATEVTTWYESAAPRAVELYRDGALVTGEYYTSNNQMESRVVQGEGLKIIRDFYGTHYRNEQISGGMVVMKLDYHPNGVLKSETPFAMGVPHGTRQTYQPSGEVATTESWLSGKQHGLSVEYKNGTIWKETPYVHGSREGVEKIYKNGSQVVEEITWFEGKKHGPHRRYLDTIVKTEWYYKDGLMPKTKQDHWTQATE